MYEKSKKFVQKRHDFIQKSMHGKDSVEFEYSQSFDTFWKRVFLALCLVGMLHLLFIIPVYLLLHFTGSIAETDFTLLRMLEGTIFLVSTVASFGAREKKLDLKLNKSAMILQSKNPATTIMFDQIKKVNFVELEIEKNSDGNERGYSENIFYPPCFKQAILELKTSIKEMNEL